jgi:hypothetical protein
VSNSRDNKYGNFTKSKDSYEEQRRRHAMLLNPYYKEDMHLKLQLPKVVEVVSGNKKKTSLSPVRNIFEQKPIIPRHRSKNTTKKHYNLQGPYAQNLAKPKLYEPKGL